MRRAQPVHSPPDPWGRNTAKQSATANSSPEDHTECGPVRAPAQGRQREEQAGPPPPKKKQGGEGGGGEETAQSHQTARQQHKRRLHPPPQKAPKTGPRKRHRGTTQPKAATPSQEQWPTRKRDTETCRHTPRKKRNKEPAAKPERKGMGGQGPQGPGQGHPATDTTKPNQDKKKRKKHTPTTQPRRAGHSRDPRPAGTPTPHTGTGNGGGLAERAHNHARPISRPEPKPEHHKKPGKEGQHHKPCPNTPTKDPSQDWRG